MCMQVVFLFLERNFLLTYVYVYVNICYIDTFCFLLETYGGVLYEPLYRGNEAMVI